MSFDQVRVISKHIQPVSLAEVEHLEIRLGIRLPDGYRGFITRFGDGFYCDLFRIYTPSEILRKYSEYQDLWGASYTPDDQGKARWYYEGSEVVLNPSELEQSYIIGDTKDGDQLVFYPLQPDKIFVIPRGDRKTTALRADLSDLHQWNTTDDIIPTFEPIHDQTVLHLRSDDCSLDQMSWLKQLRKYWGEEQVIVAYQTIEIWSWTLNCFVIAIGGRIELKYEQATKRIFKQGQVSPVVVETDKHSLRVAINCDHEESPSLTVFMRDLETQGLCHWERPNSLGVHS